MAKERGYKQENPEYIFEDLIWTSDYQINQLTRTYKSVAGFGLPQELVPQAGKLKKLDELLPQLKTDGHRVLIFSQFTMVLDILEEYLAIRGHTFLRFALIIFCKIVLIIYHLNSIVCFELDSMVVHR